MTARRLVFASLTALALGVPSVAEAAPRRFFRKMPARTGTTATNLTPVKSDELVQAAIARTPTGGIADLPQGTFRTAVVIDRPMTLRAHARGTTFDGKGLGVAVVTIAPGVAAVTIEGLRVQNGSVEGILAGTHADGLTLTRVTVTGCGADGVRLEEVAGARLDLCVLDGNGDDGLDATGSDLGASRVTARSNAGAGIVVRGPRARVTELLAVGGTEGLRFASSAGVAERCRFADATTAVRFANGSWGNRVVTADVRGGVTAVEAETGSASATVVGVVVQEAAGDAIRLLGSSHVALDCTVRDVRGDGIVLGGAESRVQDTEVRGVGGEGIRIEGDRHVAEGNAIVGAAQDGIHVVSGRGNRVAGNVVLRCGGEGIADDGIDTLLSRNRMD